MEQLFADYIENRLNTQQKQELAILLANDDMLRDEFEDLKAFYTDMSTPSDIDPTATLDLGFYMMLEKEKNTEQKKKEKEQKENTGVRRITSRILKYAAGIVLLSGIFWIGRRPANKDLNDISDMASLKEDMRETKRIVSMLQNESASERIQAVNYSYNLSKPDDKVLEALIKTLNTDTNINVRTAEALSHFRTEKIARDALIQALLTQKELTLQITVIDILVGLGDKRAVKTIQKPLQSADTEDFVKRKAIESVKVLSL